MKARNWWKLPLLYSCVALVSGAFFCAEHVYGKSSRDKCKDHDRCKEHDKCRQHDKGHQKCKPKVDKCKTHDRCEAHDKCRVHEKGHQKCKPKDQHKDHDRCKPHDKCRQHDRAHRNCPPRNPPNNPPTNRPPAQVTRYSGQAVVVHLTNLLHGPASVLIGDTGQLNSTGGVVVVNVDSTNVQDFLKIDMARAQLSGRGHESLSEVSITDFTLEILATNGTEHVVSFDSMTVVARAECRATGEARVSASVNISGLQIDNQAITVTGQANQRIDYDGGHIIINRQTSLTSSNYGEVSVSGLWIHNDGCMEGPIGFAHADIRCGSTNGHSGGGGGGGGGGNGGDCPDRVTGGGFILDSGERANFGVGGGIQNGRLWGHLNYKDHGTGMHVKATEVTDYDVVDADTRMIKYNVTIDGQAGTATVVVTDAGEPGRDDIFVIQLSNGYMAGGDLGGSGKGGGNIQFHKGKCGDGHDDGDNDNGNGGHGDDDDGDNDNGSGGKECKDKNCKDCKSGKGHGDDDDDD